MSHPSPYQSAVEILFNIIIIYRYALGFLLIFLWPLFLWYKPLLLSSATKDTVSVVCATTNTKSSLLVSVESWLANDPQEVIIVTDIKSHKFVAQLLETHGSRIKVLTAPVINKRIQLCLGFANCTSSIIVIADDDTIWWPTSLISMISPFHSLPRLGGVFPEVQIRPQGRSLTIWEELAAIRLFGDAIDGRASILLDGGVFCGSGSTAAYRASILQDEAFQSIFQHETWLGNRLNAGDDQSLTRWLCKRGWDVLVVPDDKSGNGCHIETHMRPTWRHLLQLLRWSRSDWQANIWVVMVERHIWRLVGQNLLTKDGNGL